MLKGHEGVFLKIFYVIVRSVFWIGIKNPCHMRMKKALGDGVGVAFFVDESMVVAVVGAPLDGGVLKGASAKK